MLAPWKESYGKSRQHIKKNTHTHTHKDINLTTKFHLVKAMVFPVAMHEYESWTIKKAVQFNSIIQSCLTLCDPMDCNKPVSPVHYQIPELAQIHVNQVGDAIQPSHPLSSPSPPNFNLS